MPAKDPPILKLDNLLGEISPMYCRLVCVSLALGWLYIANL